jgi:histidinol-phosphate/aromatic aminotransferase/cobyric acid decarboxylase-like protein
MKIDSIKDRVAALQAEFRFTPPLAAALEEAMKRLAVDVFGVFDPNNPAGGFINEQVQRERGPPQATPDTAA